MNIQPPADTSHMRPEGPSLESPSQSLCRKCGKRIEAPVKYCPHCGCKLNAAVAWYYQPVWILILAFFVLGPVALLLVWKSPKMGRTAKVIMAILISVYSVYCLYLFYEFLVVEMKMVNDFNRVMRQMK
jgi:hypothetical protein